MVRVKCAKDIMRLILQSRNPTGTENSDGATYERGVRPVREIKPGYTGLAMTGKREGLYGMNVCGKNADRNTSGRGE